MENKQIPETSWAVKFLFRWWSSFYDNPLPQKIFYGRIHKKLLNKLGHQDFTNIMDVGCGTGKLIEKMTGCWPKADFSGLDISPEMLEVAKNKNYNCNSISFLNNTVYKIPVEDNQFDLITSTISSHFYQDFDLALKELFRVLKPGGVLIMASLSNGSLRLLPGNLGRFIATPHLVLRSPKFQKQSFQEAGFESIKANYLFSSVWLYTGSKPSGDGHPY